MAHRVLEVPSAKRGDLDQLLAEDAVSRQSITVKDAKAFDLARAGVILILEGDEKVLEHAEARVKAMGGAVPPEAAAVYARFREESDEAAGGMGFVFG
jgi:hypothetical protein